MTNAQIIVEAMLLAELDPEEVVVDTFAGWKRKGYTVKKGEKAVFQTSIWKPSKKNHVKESEVEENEVPTEDTEKHTYLHLVKASFFTSDQVEKKEEK